MKDEIPFNRISLTGKETGYLERAIRNGKLSGNGEFTRACQQWLERRYGFTRAFLTTSCTDALEMAALLCDLNPGDEVIVPSFTFPSTANAFLLRGARVVLADTEADRPNLSIREVERLITPRTRAVVPVHYAGISCDMEPLLDLAESANLKVVEDCAHSLDGFYRESPLGSLGHFGAFSFHDTKSVTCGEGGALTLNSESLVARAEIHWEKGTNRMAFLRGEIDEYQWVGMGSSYLPSELVAAFLLGQLEGIDPIQLDREGQWDRYYVGLRSLEERECIALPSVPSYARQNGHLFYLTCRSPEERRNLTAYLRKGGITVQPHYSPLHLSPNLGETSRQFPNSEKFGGQLLRLPLYRGLEGGQIDRIVHRIEEYYRSDLA